MRVISGLDDECLSLSEILQKNGNLGDSSIIKPSVDKALQKAGLNPQCQITSGCVIPSGQYDTVILDSLQFSRQITPTPIISPGYGLIYAGDLHILPAASLDIIKNNQSIGYVATQIILSAGYDNKEIELIQDMAKAGKRIILQFFFGSGGPYNWSYCGYPHIALQPEVQEYLFSEFDRIINLIGPSNLHAAHMLEEDGSMMGLDIDVSASDWRKNKGAIRDGSDTGNPYSKNSSLLNAGGKAHSRCWNTDVGNVKYYANLFMEETGIDMFSPKTAQESMILLLWMGRRLWAGAHRAFLTWLKNNYPQIKRFVWGTTATDWNIADIGSLKEIAQGFIIDPYGDIISNNSDLRGVQVNLPDKEFHTLVFYGNVEKKLADATVAKINNSASVGFFNDHGISVLNEDIQIFNLMGKMRGKSVKPRSLIITGNTDNGYSTNKIMLPMFVFPDVVLKRDSYNVNINQYKIITFFYSYSGSFTKEYSIKAIGISDKELNAWVSNGGLLFLVCLPPATGLAATGSFLNEFAEFRYYENKAVQVKSSETAIKMLGLKPEYNMSFNMQQMIPKKQPAIDLPVGGVFEHGSGIICFNPIQNLDSVLLNSATPQSQKVTMINGVASYIADVMRGVINWKAPAYANEISLPGEPYKLKYANDDFYAEVTDDWWGQTVNSRIIKR